MRKKRLSPRQAASRLQVSLGQLHELVEADWLAEPDERGTLAVDSVEALEKLLVALEVGLLGLDLLDRPPAYLTPSQAATWLGVDEDALVDLVDRGVLEAISFEELGDLEIVELLRAVEAAAPEANWTDEDALWVDTKCWQVKRMGYGLRQRDRDESPTPRSNKLTGA